jgi:hypothetical protein
MKRLKELRAKGFNTKYIEETVNESIGNLRKGEADSFVIYGDPQSGKTELMIALTARLLDDDHKVIVVLINDIVSLLKQNLSRFQKANLDPAPKNFSEIMEPDVNPKEGTWVIFCKKNPRDLQNLLNKIESIPSKVILDDEADYATPNSNVNKEVEKRTTINKLVLRLINDTGIYIGVTATPARLDLNNTANNDNEKWVLFKSHDEYTGQEIFFPTTDNATAQGFTLNLLPDEDGSPGYLRDAFFSFLVNASYLNLEVHKKTTVNYSMLIHTSGKKADHSEDRRQIVKIVEALKDNSDKNFAKYVQKIWEIAKKRYPGQQDEITAFIIENIGQNNLVLMNSDRDKSTTDFDTATDPTALFTIAIGGNIVSRGVTFNNLLSMFFTRDVKHKIQQDTYIQRARMFGTRGKYLMYFELHIPESLYLDWQKCFVFHRLALESIQNGTGAPVWLEDKRISAAAPSSIDHSTVDMDSGEMSFEMFDFTKEVSSIPQAKGTSFERLQQLSDLVGDKAFPPYVISFIKNLSPDGPDSLAIHPPGDVTRYVDADHKKIERPRGLIGRREREVELYPLAIHHIKIFTNDNGKARVFYRYTANIKFLKNKKKVEVTTGL